MNKKISIRRCVRCDKILTTRFKIKFCSNKCQATGKYLDSLKEWRDGTKNGSVGIGSRIISSTIRRYLFEKYRGKCAMCGWSKVNKVSGRIPLEVDHIDGNAENNKENNLRLICPNCHALTPHFRNLNKGNGRTWRKEKIGKIVKKEKENQIKY
ncbi:MAG: HNH endonuclease signature motif containing protein [bacterium]|nr:HNH endonuclease signature motif containing protein [bacterium]